MDTNSRLMSVQCDIWPFTIHAMIHDAITTTEYGTMNTRLMTLSEAANELPRFNGKQIHVSTLWRWCRKGIRCVCLEYVKVGRKVMVSQEGLNRFFTALAQADAEQAQKNAVGSHRRNRRPCTNATRQRAKQEADAILRKAKILV